MRVPLRPAERRDRAGQRDRVSVHVLSAAAGVARPNARASLPGSRHPDRSRLAGTAAAADGVFRQRPWLPWWLAVVVPVAVALAILLVSLLPKQATVPNLKGAANVFAAQKLLNGAGFQLAPRTTAVVDATKQPGAIADQSPRAGTKAKRGTIVTVAVYTGTGMAAVPSVLGATPGLADQALRASQLTLGAVNPQPLEPGRKDPLSDSPGGDQGRCGHGGRGVHGARRGGGRGRRCDGGRDRGGSAMPRRGRRGGRRDARRARSRGGAGGQGPDHGAGGAGRSDRRGRQALATRPRAGANKRLATVPVGALAGTVPVAGAKVPKGAQVDLLISSGSPGLAYDDGQAVHVIDPTTREASRHAFPPGVGPRGGGGVEPGRNPPRRVRGRAARARPAGLAGSEAVHVDPAATRHRGCQSRIRADHEGAHHCVRRAIGGARSALLRDDRPLCPQLRLHKCSGLGPRGPGGLVSRWLDDPPPGDPQPRREFRSARLHQQRPVLDARVGLGPRDPADERIRRWSGRVRRARSRPTESGWRWSRTSAARTSICTSCRPATFSPPRPNNCRCAPAR